MALDTLRRLLEFKGAEPEHVEYWELRWALAYRHLEASGSKALARRKGEAEEAMAIAAHKPDRLHIVADQIQAKQDRARHRALRAAELPLGELDRSLPNARQKFGYGPAACWVDLTDYLRRLILLFTEHEAHEKFNRHTLSELLPHLAGLAEVTGVAGWRKLAEQIAATYEEADRKGWEVMPSPSIERTVPDIYVDRYSHFRAQAGRRAAQLARESVFLAEKPVLFPSSPVDLDRYDPPRSSYRHAAPVSAVCAGALPFGLWVTGAPAPWLAVGLHSLVVFLGMWLVCLVCKAEARPDQEQAATDRPDSPIWSSEAL
ncbi:hypothetical protein OG982_29870 [Streptomyces sp. NBC_01551]|uniref:hypothetical protein n=1 Tax=Streptomyces sp. NBC_01551 TaxID=2975876 RepID=UPI00225A426F|nr:hypothetical protein [Streptomyces sp. NBC_01551]MCX4529852.1 hypothetical protein [Streptomyces sp. NBC_01551]